MDALDPFKVPPSFGSSLFPYFLAEPVLLSSVYLERALTSLWTSLTLCHLDISYKIWNRTRYNQRHSGLTSIHAILTRKILLVIASRTPCTERNEG